MARILEFLLGMDRIRLGDGGRVVLTFLSGWPAWAVFLALLAGAAFVVFVYMRENRDMPPGVRGILMVLRFGIIVMAIIMLQEPALKLERNRTIRSAVAVLVDTSASMGITDGLQTGPDRQTVEQALSRGKVTPGDAERPSRYEVARAAIGLDGAAALKQLADEQRIYLYTFDESPRLLKRIDRPEDVDEALAMLKDTPENGTRTMPTQSMETVLDQLAGQTLTGMILVTDGQGTTQADTTKLDEMAEARNLPFFTLGVGSEERPKDVELQRVNAERRAFVNEELPVRVELANSGYDGQRVDVEIEVKDHPELSVTQEIQLDGNGGKQSAELRFKPDKAGKYELTVKVEPLDGEFDKDNNTSLPQEVDVLDRKLKVLMIEDLPRWEYKYLMTALYRDPTVLVSVLLNSADILFAPEGDLPIKTFPATKEELFQYDVIVIGDVDRRMFSGEQLQWIDEFVRVKGGGLIFIAGDRMHDPNSYVGTPLETLLPIEISDEQYTGEITQSFTPEMTIEGTVSPILRFEKDFEENRRVWRDLPGFFWYYRARSAKPGAQVILEHPTDVSPYSGEKYPLAVMQRVEAGQVYFAATDETWRWRYYTGRRYFNNFWLQLIRHMALPQEQATIETESVRYTLGDKARIQMRIADPSSVSADVQTIKAAVTTVDSDGRERQDEVELRRTNPRLAIFEGEFTPERIGKYVLAGEVALIKGSVRAESDFQVTASREEFRTPIKNVDYLAKVAKFGEQKGGTIGVLDIGRQLATIANESKKVPNDITDEVWDSPAALGLFILMIATEWIVRKKYRML